jgi:hypothetical protein
MGAGSVRGQRPDLIVYDEAVDVPESPYKLEEPPDNLKGAFLSGTLVHTSFSGVAYINIQREWDEWKVRLERIARERGIRMGLKAWLDTGATESRAQMIVQLQVDDPELPDAHRVKTYQAIDGWPQEAIWKALHAAGLVLERELP